MVPSIEYEAPDAIRAVLAAPGRTEDVRFSPSGGRVAIAMFDRNQIVVLGIEITRSTAGPGVTVRRCVLLESRTLHGPHGLAFLDENTLVVASRHGGVEVYCVPDSEGLITRCAVTPSQTLSAALDPFKEPSALTVVPAGRDTHDVYVCDNAADTVVRIRLSAGTTFRQQEATTPLRRWLSVPDSVAVSRDGGWLAISNHGTNDVLLFDTATDLHADTLPAGLLRGMRFPHGLCFSPDDQHLFVCDAEAPFVHVFTRGSKGWRGIHRPWATVQVMSEAIFERGHIGRGDGGPKGFDIDPISGLAVTACAEEPLTFFALERLLTEADRVGRSEHGVLTSLDYELVALDERRRTMLALRKAQGRIRALKQRLPMRIARRVNRLVAAVRSVFPS